MNIRNNKIDSGNRESLRKKLLSATIMSAAIACGCLEDVEARLSAGVCKILQFHGNICPPIVSAYASTPTAELFAQENASLANILANAVARPLAFIASGGAAGANAAFPAVATFVDTAPAPAVIAAAVGAAPAAGGVGYASSAAVVGVIGGGLAPAAVGAGAMPNFNAAKLAAARLIVAAGRAAAAAAAGMPAGWADRHLNKAAVRAAAVVAAFGGPGGHVGAVTAAPGAAAAAAIAGADRIVAAFVGIPTAGIVGLAVGFAGIAGVQNYASNLWNHCIERAHFWQVSNGLEGAEANVNYIAWCRAARINLGGVGINSSFVVPETTTFGTHFDNIITAARLTANKAVGRAAPEATLLDVSWNGTLNGVVVAGPAPVMVPVAGAVHVNVHIKVGHEKASTTMAHVGKAIKCNINAAWGVPAPAGVPVAMLAAGTSLLDEARTTLDMVLEASLPGGASAGWGYLGGGGFPGIAIPSLAGVALPGGTFLPVGGVPASAATPQPLEIVTIGTNLGHIATMVAE